MKADPIVITGMGICCAIGNSVSEVVASIQQARSGLASFEFPFSAELKTRFAAVNTQFFPSERIPDTELARWDRGTQMAAYAAIEALQQSKLDDVAARGRLGIAAGMSGSSQIHPPSTAMLDDVSALEMADIIMQRNVPHFQTYELGRYFQASGPTITVCSASAGSGIAIGLARRWLQHGMADCVLAGGGEGLLPLNLVGFDVLGLLSEEPCSPFSKSTGMSMGEGAGFVVLERLSHALRRGATVLGELGSVAVTSDAYDGIQFDPSGHGLSRAMQGALKEADVCTCQVGWIRASGAGGREQDAAELMAIQSVFHEESPPISSLEPFFGHTNGAGPAIGLITGLACQQQELIPPTLNVAEEPSRGEFDIVANVPRTSRFDRFLSSTAAFGGTNVVLVAGKREEADCDASPNDVEPLSIVITGIGIVSNVGCGGRDAAVAMNDHVMNRTNASSNRSIVECFSARRILPEINLRGCDSLTQYAASAVKLAIEDAKLHAGSNSDTRSDGSYSDRLGIVCGLARTSGRTLEKLFEELKGTWARPSLARTLLRKGRFYVTSRLANWFGLKGFNATIADGIGAGGSALAGAALQLASDTSLDAIIVTAADEYSELYEKLHATLGLLPEVVPSGDAGQASEQRLLGEGAVALVLERAETARARGARPLATLQGLDIVFDSQERRQGDVEKLQSAYHRSTLEQAIANSLSQSRVSADEIDLVVGNAFGNRNLDGLETLAVQSMFGGDTNYRSVAAETGLLESTCSLMSVAAAIGAMHAEQSNDQASTRRPVRTAVVTVATDQGASQAFVLTKPTPA